MVNCTRLRMVVYIMQFIDFTFSHFLFCELFVLDRSLIRSPSQGVRRSSRWSSGRLHFMHVRLKSGPILSRGEPAPSRLALSRPGWAPRFHCSSRFARYVIPSIRATPPPSKEHPLHGFLTRAVLVGRTSMSGVVRCQRL